MPRFPPIEPYTTGRMDVGDGHRVYWETSGNPAGTPVLILHGGPGSGATPGGRRNWDPALYLIVQLDQRNCGQSTPLASDPAVSLEFNTTEHLIACLTTATTSPRSTARRSTGATGRTPLSRWNRAGRPAPASPTHSSSYSSPAS